MARFDVFELHSKTVPLVVDVQASLLDELMSRVVVPLLPFSRAKAEILPRLKPKITVGGQDYVLITTDIAALPVTRLGRCIANIEATHRDDITAALDFLFQGF